MRRLVLALCAAVLVLTAAVGVLAYDAYWPEPDYSVAGAEEQAQWDANEAYWECVYEKESHLDCLDLKPRRQP